MNRSTDFYMKLKKLDRRFTANSKFEYAVDFDHYNLASRLKFFEMREWCWHTWGGTINLKDWLEVGDLILNCSSANPHWSYENNENAVRLYFRTLPEASTFSLKWL